MRFQRMLKRFFWITLIVGAIGCLAFATTAEAKKVSLEWKPIKGAVQYELQIEHDGKVVVQKILEDTSWSGEVGFGFFAYQIRAIDKLKRPGKWSQPRPLVAMPQSPDLTSPSDGRKVSLYNPSATTVLRWAAVPGATKYKVEVKRDGRGFVTNYTNAPAFDLKGLTSGEYSWRVTAVIEPSGRTPASLAGKRWESKPSDENEFVIDQRKLGAAIPIMPQGSIWPSEDGKTEFRWKDVEGAEAYELRVTINKLKGAQRSVATVSKPIMSKANSIVLKLPGEGTYSWEVAAVSNIDSKNIAGAVGPKTTTEFEVDRNAKFLEGSGYVAFSGMFAPYTLKSVIPSRGFEGSTSSTAVTARLSGEYWFKPQWAGAAAWENTSFTIGNQNLTRRQYELTLKYRANLTNDKFGWSIVPKAGLEMREYHRLEPLTSNGNVTGFDTRTLEALGFAVGLDIRKQFTEKFSLGGKLSYYVPVSMSVPGEDQVTLTPTGSAAYRNVSVGLQGLYWLNKRWGLGMGAYVEQRSISYTVSSPNSSSNINNSSPEELYMDAAYFFGSLIYSFGR